MNTKFSLVVDIKNSSTEKKFQVKMVTGVYFTDQKLKNADSAFWRQIDIFWQKTSFYTILIQFEPFEPK